MTEDSEELLRLLHAWDRTVQALADPGEPVWPAVVEKGTVLRPGASEQTIAAAESRTGLTFPPSYREFLRLCDGAFATGLGVVTVSQQEWLTGSSEPGLGLLAADDVVRLTEGAPLAVEAMTQDSGPFGDWAGDGTDVMDTRPLLSGRALLISAVDDADLTALVDTGADEWQLWQFARDGITAWSSFTAWLRSAAEDPGLDRVRELLRLARENDLRGVGLQKVREAAAKPMLFTALAEVEDLDRQHLLIEGIVTALGTIGGDDAVDAIAVWFDKIPGAFYVADALRRIGTPHARDALAREGCYEQLIELRDPRGPELALEALASGKAGAASHLRRAPSRDYIPALRAAWDATSHEGPQLRIAWALYDCGAPDGAEHLQEIADNPQHRWHDQARQGLLHPPKLTPGD